MLSGESIHRCRVSHRWLKLGKRRRETVWVHAANLASGHRFGNQPDRQGWIKSRVSADTRIMADKAGGWNDLHSRFEVSRVDHGKLYSDGHGAESFFSRLRRGEIGHHHHIAGPYLIRYGQEATWREDHRRVDNGTQVRAVSGLAMAAPTSVDWCGYWQRGRRVG